ncbi:MAG: EAL and HDOD domain-containing protein [Brevinema sp.]
MSILLGRQSIVDVHQNIVAYELLFRSMDHSPIDCDTEATANVISNTLSMMSIDNVLGNKRGFINIGIEILKKGLLDIIPAKRFVIEILETQAPSDELVSLIKKFKHKGYIFALDDFIINEDQLEYWKPILDEVHIVKVDIMDTSPENLRQKTELLKSFKITMLAEKVETEEMFLLCKELGYQYFQGYFFTKPVILESQDISPPIQGILSVVGQLQQDADITEIENQLKAHPELVISLLKIVNSSSVSPVQEITSVRQAIALLGKKALTQWLLLLLYSYKTQNDPHQHTKDNPLFLMATQRGKIMEYLLSQTTPNVSKSLKDEAFLTGILSLSDALLNISMTQILQELHLSPVISNAILHNEGRLGAFLELTKSFEIFDIMKIANQSTKLGVSPEMINHASHLSLKFAKELASQI